MTRLSIRMKIIIGSSLTIILTVLFIALALSYQVNNRINQDIQRNFKDRADIFGRIQEIRSRQLAQSAILLADAPALRAAVSTQDAQTVNQKLNDEFRYLLDIDPIIPEDMIPQSYFENIDSAGLLVASDADGVILGQVSSHSPSRFSIAERPGISAALQGEYITSPSIWNVSGQYYTVVSIPIFSGDMVIGALSYGFPFRALEAQQLANDLESEISFFIQGSLVSTSFSGLSSDEKLELSKKISSIGIEVNTTGQSKSFIHPLHDEDWQVFVSPIQLYQGDEQPMAYYVIASSYTKRLKELYSLQKSIFILGLIGIIFSILVSYILANYFTKPIDQLVSGIRRMESGDYKNPVHVTTNDELGLLTKTFNNLQQSVAEKFEILKFVSKATLDAVKKNLTDRDLGGQRKELSIFFSDIRSFTKWCEKRPPEEVITMLNQMLSFQADIIKKFGGDIDKFVGDELVAIFEGDNKENRAVQAAIEIQQLAKEKIRAFAGDEIGIGIGINTGTVVMGAMGSDERMDFTVLGNHVNLGARICSQAEAHQILVSEHTAKHLNRTILLHHREPIFVKGIEKPITIFSVDFSYN